MWLDHWYHAISLLIVAFTFSFTTYMTELRIEFYSGFFVGIQNAMVKPWQNTLNRHYAEATITTPLDKCLICLTTLYFVSNDMRLWLSKYTLILSLVNKFWIFRKRRSGEMFIVERHFHMAQYVQSTSNTAFKRVHFKSMYWVWLYNVGVCHTFWGAHFEA